MTLHGIGELFVLDFHGVVWCYGCQWSTTVLYEWDREWCKGELLRRFQEHVSQT